ncbi:MAG TPA: CHRD domain-containing protein [Rhizomicrobium sp.]|nr:CHRD domain-containing protein [Rhizomicrobium sp.]
MSFDRTMAWRVTTALAFCALVPAESAMGASAHYVADLDPAPMTLATRPDLTGEGSITADLDGSILQVRGNFAGLSSPALDARLQAASAAGLPGSVVADLDVTKAANGTISGSVKLTRAQAESLRKGGLYVQIDTAKSHPPYGTLWGFFLPPEQ